MILTDHLNSVRDIQRIRADLFEDDGWKPRPGHELYRWLLSKVPGNATVVKHIKAHTEAKDKESRLNDAADREANFAHHSAQTILLPPLTGWMRPFVPYIPGVGYAQDNWKDHLNNATTESIYGNQSAGLRRRTVGPILACHYRLRPNIFTNTPQQV